MAELERQMCTGRGGGYGLDAELARKKAANYDYAAEEKAQQWIEGVTGEAVEGGFGPGLKDGVLLCKLLNGIKAGTVKRINASKMPFKQMENVSSFLKACRVLGVPEHSLFETVDLFEEKDLGLVVQCLFALGCAVKRTCPEFAGPHLGVNASAASAPTPKNSVSEPAPGHQATAPAPVEQVAAQLEASKLSPAALEPQVTPVDVNSPAEEVMRAKEAGERVLEGQGERPAGMRAEEASRQYTGTRGGGYGMDAELAQKQAANYDFEAEDMAREWIEAVTGASLESVSPDFGVSLKDGTVLCALVNTIKPGTIKRVNNSKMPFKQMENISAFLKACRVLGVQEHSLFETVDLYEEKDIGLVVRALHALGGAVKKSVPEYTGPSLGVRASSPTVREWSAEEKAKQRAQGAGMTKLHQGSSAVMERSDVIRTGVTMGADYAGTGDTSTVTKMHLGGSEIAERKEVVRTGITMGADYSGTSTDVGGVTKMHLGSSQTTERKEIVRTGITMGADYAGTSTDTNAVSKLHLGGSEIAERPEVVRTGITMGADYSGKAA
ncbi:unnamed protein product [Chrysoparadoxa australica]